MRPRHPLLILGLDGGSFNLLDPLMARGELPHLQALAEGGLRTELLSTWPVATLPAWTSFLTGCEPARHGVTDLLMPDRGYGLTPATGLMRSQPTFLARLSACGLRVAAVGVPGTYPPEPVNGLCIAGFDAPGARQARADAVWPAALHDDLQRFGGWRYATFNEHRRGGAAIAAAVRALCDDLARKQALLLHLLSRGPWDVFFVHLQASDTAAHHLWHTFDPNSPRHLPGHADALPQVYRRIDALIGALRQAVPPHTRVLVVSDHGMGGASDHAVHLNRFLHHLGVLTFAAGPLRQPTGKLLRGALSHLPLGSLGTALRWCPEPLRRSLMASARGMAVNFRRSAAFSHELDYAPGIWLNRRGAFPHGHLTAAQAEALQTRLCEALSQLQLHGQPLLRQVLRRQDLPPGVHAERLPDVLLDPAWPRGYRPSFLPSPGPGPWVRPLAAHEFAAPRGAGMPGVHRREGVFMAHGPELPAMELPAMAMCEAGAAVYALLGMPVPQDLDAQVPPYLAALLQAQSGAATPAAPVHHEPYTAEHRAELLARLGAMGYL